MASILVAYATRHGATREIAERIGATLAASGHRADVRAAAGVHHLDGCDAVVAGGAVYMGSWLKDARDFVHEHRAALAALPVWLFSSGPLGTSRTDREGRELVLIAEPTEFADLRETLRPRSTRVFFGALDPGKLWATERAVRAMPAVRSVLVEGDFREWSEIEAWAESIAHRLAQVPATAG
jgi:menaquinone-dependent protoporphyrinogen oxidase